MTAAILLCLEPGASPLYTRLQGPFIPLCMDRTGNERKISGASGEERVGTIGTMMRLGGRGREGIPNKGEVALA